MHRRRAARTLIAALAAASLIAPATAGAYTVKGEVSPEGDAIDFTVTPQVGDGPFTATPVKLNADVADFDATPQTKPVVIVGVPTTVSVPTTDDDIDEDDETIALEIDNVVYGDDFGTITDDDAAPALTAPDLTVSEADAGTPYVISASNPSERDIEISLTGLDGTATAPDYAVPKAVTLPAGQRSVTVKDLTITNDFDDEIDETFAVRIGTSGSGAAVADAEGVVTITNDDLRVVDIFDASLPEGDGGISNAQFIVRLNAPTFRPVTVNYVTGDGLARAPSDYLGRLGVLRFEPGQTQTTLDVGVIADDRKEPTETFAVWLTEVTNARFGDAVAVGVIADDDSEPGTDETSDVTPPKMQLGAPKAKGRRLGLNVACPSGEQRCKGRVTFFTAADRGSKVKVLRKERRLGARSFSLGGGASKRVALDLPRSILDAARRARRLKVQAFVVTQDAGGNTDTRTARATLRYRK